MLELLYLEFIGIKERNQGQLILVQNRMIVDGIVQFRILLTRSGIELLMQIPQLSS